MIDQQVEEIKGNQKVKKEMGSGGRDPQFASGGFGCLEALWVTKAIEA